MTETTATTKTITAKDMTMITFAQRFIAALGHDAPGMMDIVYCKNALSSINIKVPGFGTIWGLRLIGNDGKWEVGTIFPAGPNWIVELKLNNETPCLPTFEPNVFKRFMFSIEPDGSIGFNENQNY